MSRWFCFLVAMGLVAFRPDFGLAEGEPGLLAPFDAGALLHPEVALIQTALTATGDYAGETNGEWDPLGQRAIEAYSAREFQQAPLDLHAAALMIGFAEVIARDGWEQSFDPETGLSFALPLRLLERKHTEEGMEWMSGDAGLSVLAVRQTRAETVAAHEAVAKTQGEGGAPVDRRDPGHWTTLATRDDGLSIFQESQLLDGGWSSLRITSTPAHRHQANMIAASLGTGDSVAWDLPAGGLLEELVGDTFAFLAHATGETNPTSVSTLPVKVDTSTGSGFYLGPRLLVTASHVVATCATVSLVDGTPLKIVALDEGLDLAALRAPKPVEHWLRLRSKAAVGLGQKVNAVGYPYFGVSGTGLNVTGGNVSALAGLDDDKRFLSITAPVQPGNSGGPLLAGDGSVTGVVVARLSDDYISQTTGSLPQNVNFAVQSSELAGFLAAHNLFPKSGGMAPFDMEDGAPSDIAKSVVPIVCD